MNICRLPIYKIVACLLFWGFPIIEVCYATESGKANPFMLDEKEIAVSATQQKTIMDEECGYISRLTTPEDHINALEDAFRYAQKSILVTNYGRIYPNILKTDLFKNIIPEASSRGVKIYIRYNYDTEKESDYLAIPTQVQEYFDQFGIDVALVKTHAKIVAVDHQLVMMGSYNWLTELAGTYLSHNNSFVYEGLEAYRMTEDIWKAIKYYRNMEFAPLYERNRKKAFAYRRHPSNQSSIAYTLGQSSQITYVPLIDQHRRKVLDIFERAKNRIIILSPFVSSDGSGTYQRDFIHPLLSTLLKRNVTVCFVCLPVHKSRIEGYLLPLLKTYSRWLKVIPYDKVHAKTLIMDNSLIAEGSFNWLCAARDEISSSHKHEATLICEGEAAKSLIRNFDMSKLGKEIRKATTDPLQSLRSSKRLLEQDVDRKNNKRHRQSHLVENKDNVAYFNYRKEELEMDIWSHLPLWVELNPAYQYLSHGKFYDVMSGFNNEGYCARIDKKDYITDETGNIVYFPTIEVAKEATYGY